LPRDLLVNVNKQPCLSLGSKNYKKLAKGVIRQLKIEIGQDKERLKAWKESLKHLKEEEEKEER